MLRTQPRPAVFGGLIDYFSRIALPIRTKILAAFVVVVLLLGSVVLQFIVGGLQYKRQYDSIITNITAANGLNGYVKQAIDAEMWNIVAGKTTFGDGTQYALIDATGARIAQMMANTDSRRGRLKLDVILRTLDTLRSDIDAMGTKIAAGSSTADNEAQLDRLRDVTELIDINIQDYILFEIRRAEQQYAASQQSFVNWVWTSVVIMALAIAFSVLSTWVISESVYVPIKKLHDVTTTITQQDLAVLAAGHHADEITELGATFNLMIGQIRELLDFKMREQENLKKAELRALQAQIQPHFLYNTLDAIVWLAEAQRTEDVIKIVRAMSSFFRIGLSKGRDWISLREEIEHVRSYLSILKMRYRDVFDYRIEVDAAVMESPILKLVLQPLVENALYHGIKNKRNGGLIVLSGGALDAHTVRLEVSDDGVGMTADQLARIRAVLQTEDAVPADDAGYGLHNVNTRVQLYYGRAYGLVIDSEPGMGTRVFLTIPLRPGNGDAKES